MYREEGNMGRGVTLVEAVETLSNIADMDFEHDIGVAQSHEFIVQGRPFSYRTVHWLQEQDPEGTVNVIRDTFRVVLNYLHDFYQNEYRSLESEQAMDEIKTIMVLVGEAAKKLDKYTRLFHKQKFRSVTDLREYRDLQDFYMTRIARKVDEGTIGKWILGITKEALRKKTPQKLAGRVGTATDHIFVDLDSVKKDTEYELFFLRKENGTRFFSPRLIRNVKLVCDFGHYFGDEVGDDPLISLRIWLDQMMQSAAEEILMTLGSTINQYFERTSKSRQKRELVTNLNKAFMALMLAADENHLMRNVPPKSCLEYFEDFQVFLRQGLNSRDFGKLQAYPPKRSNTFGHCLVETVEKLCKALYVGISPYQCMADPINQIIADANENLSPEHLQEARASQTWWNRIASDHIALTKSLRRHQGGPLNKLLKNLEEGTFNGFDPLLQDNLPTTRYQLYFNQTESTNVCFPAPLFQEYINKAKVLEEFKAFIRSYGKDKGKKKHLYINFQDRTSWREHFRSSALEDLQKLPDLKNHLVVVTLPKDTEFYNQLAPYNHENHADVFKRHLIEHLSDESAGFYIPALVQDKLFKGFVEGAVEGIHQLFYSGKNVLRREERIHFIEIFYLLLQIKLIEIIKPLTFNLSCKDGIDIGAAANAQLYAFIKILQEEHPDSQSIESLNQLLYGPALIVRERVILPDRFNRMLGTLKTIESVKEDKGHRSFIDQFNKLFSPLFRGSLPWELK